MTAVDEFNAIYERWQHGELDLRLPGGETGNEVLDRYVPVLTDLRMRYLDDDNWNGDIVIVSHGAAIRLASAVLAGVDAELCAGPAPGQRRVSGAGADHRRAVELCAMGSPDAAVLPGPQ